MIEAYDYQDIIDELKEEISSGMLTKSEVIQVLRAEAADETGYRAIYDWYYNKETIAIELAADKTDTKEEIKEKMQFREQYQKDKKDLQDMTVEACLAEMFEKTND